MKTLITVILTLLLIGSCNKEVCYTCTTSTYQKGSEILLYESTEIVCDVTEIEILTYQADRFNFDDPQTYTGCECKRQ